jgi:hypothetical protein
LEKQFALDKNGQVLSHLKAQPSFIEFSNDAETISGFGKFPMQEHTVQLLDYQQYIPLEQKHPL